MEKRYDLNVGTLAARGLYNITEKNGEGISFWFDVETYDRLKALSTTKFNRECSKLITQSKIK